MATYSRGWSISGNLQLDNMNSKTTRLVVKGPGTLIANFELKHLKVDNPPEVTIIEPSDGQTFEIPSDKQYIPVKVKVDANDDFGIKEIKFYVDNVYVGSRNAKPYETTISEGTHKIKVKAYDTSDQTAVDSVTSGGDLLPETLRKSYIAVYVINNGNKHANCYLKLKVSGPVNISNHFNFECWGIR